MSCATLPLEIPTGDDPLIVVNNRVSFQDFDGVRVLFVDGFLWHRYDLDDREAQAFVIGSLAFAGIAGPVELARAFGVDRKTVFRYRSRLEEEGARGVFPKKRGPKGPHKANRVMRRKILCLKGRGLSNVAVGRCVGVTENTVRRVLREEGYTPSPPPALPGLEDEVVLASEPVEEDDRELVASSAAAEEGPREETDSCKSHPGVAEAEAGAAAGGMRPVAEAVAPRTVERVMARFGVLPEAAPEPEPGENLRFAGVLLALPAILDLGILDVVVSVYRRLKPGFYGLRTFVLTLLLMALLRVKRPEWLKGLPPEVLGRHLGLDRSPEVKTVRRKLTEIAEQGRSHELVAEIARRLATEHEDLVGFLYVDGHVRAYHGQRERDKTFVPRKRICMPATTDYWVNDAGGDPIFFVTAEGHGGLAKAFPGILAELKDVIGEGRKATVVFDRGGWDLGLFAKMREDFDFLTYRKRPYDDLPAAAFTTFTEEEEGEEVHYDLADTKVEVGKAGVLRLVARLDEKGEQVHILTTREDLPAVEVAKRMRSRWRQENFFKYMREEFALDALVSYEMVPADGERLVVNPERRTAEKEVRRQRSRVKKLEQELAALSSEEAGRPTLAGFKDAVFELGTPLAGARKELDRLVERRSAIPKRVSLKEALQHEPMRLEFERKMFMDALKMMAYRAESGLVAALAPTYRRSNQEGRKLLREALAASGDFEINGRVMTVRLEPLSSAHRTKALRGLCAILSEQNAKYPGTDLVLRYAVRGDRDGAQ